LLGNFYIKKNISNAELVILTTNNLIDAYKIPKTKSKLISNGVDIKNFYYHDNAKKELNLDDFIIGYVGVLREWVNFEPVFKALNFLENNVKFMIVGSEGNINYHKKLAKRYNVQDRVIFTGMVPYSEVPLYISAMDICLVPFETSGIAENALPLKLFEYMACERPIISTDISAVKQVVGNMILYSSDTDGYIKNINCLYDDSKLRQKLGKKGRKLVEKEYDWKVIVKELEQILINVKG
jgi:glycosyltransferase involved in cell wall biosynthesis